MKNILKMDMVSGALRLKSASLLAGIQMAQEYGREITQKVTGWHSTLLCQLLRIIEGRIICLRHNIAPGIINSKTWRPLPVSVLIAEKKKKYFQMNLTVNMCAAVAEKK